MSMKFCWTTICRNETDCQNLLYSKKSLILIQSFTKEDAKNNQEGNNFRQKQDLYVPGQSRILFSVKIVMDSNEWSNLSNNKRRIIWSKSRSQLYWSCHSTINSLSLCNKPGIETLSSLTINIFDAMSSVHYLQCIICFLGDSNPEYITQWTNLSPNVDRVVLDLHRYLPQISSHHSTVQFQITRFDQISMNNEIGKVFITNISLIDELNNENPTTNKKCPFFCGWGPECLIQLHDICNTKIDCISGEDEDYRLCKAIKNGVISLNYDSQSTTSSNNNRKHDGHVVSTLKNYLFVIICAIILLALFIFVGWFMCRNCDEVDNRFGDSARKLTSTLATPDSDTSCSTCEMKSKLNSIDYFSNHSRKQLSTNKSQFPNRTAATDLQILKINRKETRFTAISSNSSNFTDKESLCHNTPYYSHKDRAIQSSEWLNLFFHVSTEARHKSLVKQPPPNVNNSSRDIVNNKNHKFSTTPLTCVFLVMI